MKRRQVLTAAGALAGASLTGCGGGGQDAAGEIAGDIGSEIGSEVEAPEYFSPSAMQTSGVPADLVPANRNYHIEVTFYTTREIEVYMESRKGVTTLIASKGVTKGKSHKLGLALWRCNLGWRNDKSDFYLVVREREEGSWLNQAIWHETLAGNQNTSANKFRYYADHYDGWREHEWTFASRRDGATIVKVKFFPYANGEAATVWNPGEYVRPIANTAMRDNKNPLDTIHHPVLHEPASMHERHAGVLPNEVRDTILLPSPRGRADHHELVPTYMSASAAEKPLLQRRIFRHIWQFTKSAYEAGHRLESSVGHHVHHMVGNEVARVMGGKGLIDHLKSTRDQVINTIGNSFKQVGGEFEKFCIDNLPQLSSDSMENAARQLQDSLDADDEVSHWGRGKGVTVSLQIAQTFAQKNWPWPFWNLGGGFRLSFGLAKASSVVNSGERSTDKYTIADIPTRGIKLAVTVIIKGMSTETFQIVGVDTNFSLDIEVTFHMTVLNGVWRLDLVQIDPVFDLDGRWIIHALEMGISNLTGVETLVPSALEISQFTQAIAAAMTNVPMVISNVVGETPIPGLDEYIKNLVTEARGSVYQHSFEVIEGSPLRFMIPNKDLGDPTIPFRGGWQFGSWGWQPGLKNIAGFGLRRDFTSPTGFMSRGFIRVVAVGDVYVLRGSRAFMDASGFPWAM